MQNKIDRTANVYARCTQCSEVKCAAPCNKFVRLHPPVAGEERTGLCRKCAAEKAKP